MTELIKKNGNKFLKWFSQNLVMTKIPLEKNCHSLYDKILRLVNNDDLDNYVRFETLRNIKAILKNKNIEKRQLLINNLGNWLGLITIGRNRPILLKELDLKHMLFEAFHKGPSEMIQIVPFVINVISASNKSSLFGPNCAWISALIKILVEIYNKTDLLKSEIEILCKELNIDMNRVEIGNYLMPQTVNNFLNKRIFFRYFQVFRHEK